MLNRETVESDPSLVDTTPAQQRALEIPGAFPVRFQTLDLARHVVTAPDGKRYVVATFDDRRVGHGYTTAVYPQQNGYLTLIRLTMYQVSSETPEQAIQQHLNLAQVIQQGKLSSLQK